MEGQVITIEHEAFKSLIKKLDEVKNCFSNSREKESEEEEWLPSVEVLKLLKISKRTLQNYRERGILSYSQFGAKIYFKKTDIISHLEKNYIKTPSGYF